MALAWIGGNGWWLAVIAVLLVTLGAWSLRTRYRPGGARVRIEPPLSPIEPVIRAYVLVSHTWPATNRAIRYAQLLHPADITCVHVEEGRADEFRLDWVGLYPEYPLTVVSNHHGGLVHPLCAYLRDERAAHPAGFMTVVVPEVARSRHWLQLLAHHRALLVKAGLAHEEGLTVTDVVFVPGPLRTGDEPQVPDVLRRIAVVPVRDITRPTRHAVAYAQATAPSELHVVHVEVNRTHAIALREQWKAETGTPLEIVPSPHRTIVRPVVDYVRSVRDRAEPGTIVNVILPERIMPTTLGQLVHNRPALALKAKLLFEPDVAVTSSPWHAPSPARTGHPDPADSQS